MQKDESGQCVDFCAFRVYNLRTTVLGEVMKVKHYKVTNKKRFGIAVGAAVAAGVAAAGAAVYFLFFVKPELTLDREVYDITNLQGAVVTPTYTGKEVLKFTSGDETVFSVDIEGNIVAVGNGEAVLTVLDEKHDVWDTATVRSTIMVTAIDAGRDLTLTEGDKAELKPGVTPDNAKDTTLTYSASSDVVKVDENGNITAQKEGKAVITVTNEASGISTEVNVTVKAKPVAQTTTTTTTGNSAKLTYIDGILIANKTYALPSSYAPGVQKAAQDAFNQMKADAAKEGLNLFIVSGYRSYEYQKNLYNRYVARDGKAQADTYSARPGHSEHQTGLAFDICSLETSFENTAEGKWLAANSYKYGFILRYPKGKQPITGYIYEPWHFRYIGVDKATAVYQSGLCLEEYLGITSKYAD